MSVYKSKRKTSKAAYLYKGKLLFQFTDTQLSKMPQRYRYVITNKMNDLINEYYSNAIKANSIFIHKSINYRDYQKRHSFLLDAQASLESFSAYLTILYEKLKKGNTVYEDIEQMDRVFYQWGNRVDECSKLLRSIIKSDEKRWKEIKEERDKKKASKEKSEIDAPCEVTENISEDLMKETKDNLKEQGINDPTHFGKEFNEANKKKRQIKKNNHSKGFDDNFEDDEDLQDIKSEDRLPF